MMFHEAARFKQAWLVCRGDHEDGVDELKREVLWNKLNNELKKDVCCIYCISRLNVYVAACVLDAFKTKSFFHFPPHFLLIGSQSQSFRAVNPRFALSLRGNLFDAAII